MSDSKDGAAAALMVALIVILFLMACGAGVFLLMQQTTSRQQLELAQRDLAVAEAVRLQAKIEHEQAQAAAMSSSTSDQTPEDLESSEALETAIRDVLLTQQAAWNAGDIERFMEFYWKSDDLTFSSEGKVTRTWQGTLDNYKQRYPSRREMGELSFENLKITTLGPQAAFVLGDWKLSRDSGMLGGNFTLVLRRLNGKWLIVHDHTSRTTEP